ncbi:MAG: alpha/beta fold hydrolase [Pseudomonadales bacterium]
MQRQQQTFSSGRAPLRQPLGRWRLMIALGCSIGLAAPDGAAQAGAFARLPAIESVRISPDGSKAVILRALQDSYHVTVADFANGTSRLVMASKPDEFLFNWCRWANDERLVCSIRSYGEIRAGQYGNGFRRYRDGRVTMTRLLAVNQDGSDVLQLVPDAVTRPGGDLEWNAPDQDTIVSWLPGDPRHVLIQLAREDRLYPSVYRLDIYDNGLQRVQRYSSRVLSWYADDQGELKLATGYDERSEPVAFRLGNGSLEELDISPLAGVRPPQPLAFAGDAAGIYVLGNGGRDTRGIYRVDLGSGRILEPLYLDDSHDVGGGLLVSKRTHAPLLLQYPQISLHQVWFDPTLERDFAALRDALPGKPARVWLRDVDDAANSLILYAEGSGTVPAWYLFDRTKRALVLLGSNYPGGQAVTELQPARVTARDGTPIPAYYALPGPAAQGPYPVVLLPHGGPYLRDDDSFDYWAQVLLSNGYAVMKPNYRGSSGYGDRYLSDGFDQWGLKMQDDLIDALDWMIGRGLADPQRACIVGGSYGGYAALVAAYKTPQRFRCAVSFAGVTDLDGLVDRLRNFRFGELSIARIQQGEARRANSPLANVDRMGVPLLIVHGDADRSVMVEQSRTLVQALEKAGKPHLYIEQADGDHFLSVQSHRVEFFEALLAFLQQHLARHDDDAP